MAKLDQTMIEAFIIEFFNQAANSAPLVWLLPYLDT
jgi:hypothetical protein